LVYHAYGKSIETDLVFDALPRAERTSDTIRIEIDRVSEIPQNLGKPIRPGRAQGRVLSVYFQDGYAVVQVDELLQFELWLSSTLIRCNIVSDVGEESLRYWILQQIIPVFLLLSGSTDFLHGMAIGAEPSKATSAASCLGFIGPSYSGKSTLLSYFLARGHMLVTDDQLALTKQTYTDVLPSVPFYRPYRAAEDLGKHVENFSPHSIPLQRIYLLEPVPAAGELKIQLISGMEAILALKPHFHYSLGNVERPELFALARERFEGLIRIVQQIPLARLFVPRSKERLPEVYDLLQRELTV
jgi:hypothetical protein